MLRESSTSVITRNEIWRGDSASEPIEAGWAREAIFFVRALRPAHGPLAQAFAEISPDGIHWAREGSGIALPEQPDAVVALRVSHFGNWLRLRTVLPDRSEYAVLVTVHLK